MAGLISKVILCLAVPGFASTPLLNRGIIIACRKEFVQFLALRWQQPAALCCFPCFHNSAEPVPLEQGQVQADAPTTLPSPDYLSSLAGQHTGTVPRSLQKYQKDCDTKPEPLPACSPLTASRWLCSTPMTQPSHAFVQKDPRRDVPVRFWCRENHC